MNLLPSSLRRLAALLLFAGVSLQLGATLSLTPLPTNAVLPRQYAPGSTLTISAIPAATGATYQWFHNGAPIAGATTATLTVTNLAAADSGNYRALQTVGTLSEISPDLVVNVLPFPPSPVDPTFTAQLPATFKSPTVLFSFPDGSLIVRAVDGTTIRLNSDGSTDTSFTYSGTGLVLATLADRGLITSRSPYRVSPDGTPRPLPLPAGFDSTADLTGAASQPDGKVLIAQGNVVARLNADDTLDPSFTYSSSLGSQHVVNGFTLDAAGRIYVYATENDPVPGHFPSFWPIYVRLFPTGARDPAFIGLTPPLLRGTVKVFPLNDGRVMTVTSYEGILTFAMVKSDGTPDSNWSAPSSLFSPGYSQYLTVDPAANRLFDVDTTFTPKVRRLSITATTLVDDLSFYPGGTSASSVALATGGKLIVGGTFLAWDAHPTTYLARLDGTASVATLPPVALAIPYNIIPTRGSTVKFSSRVDGTGPFTYQWLALDQQPLPADTTSPDLVLSNFDRPNLGRYQLRVTGPGGTVLSNVDAILLGQSTGQQPFLANLSGRASIGTGDDTAIAGIATKVYSGALGIPTLIRGAGPALGSYGVTSFLPNPVLNLYNAAGQLVGNNDNWNSDPVISAAADSTGAFPFQNGSNDAALLRDFGTANTTIQLVDASGASGVGLLEIYRRPSTQLIPSDILNLSLRARTGPGEKVATAGFVIVDPQDFGRSARLLIRVVGPTLAQYGVAFPLVDPVLTLYRADGTVAAQNNNWSESTDVASLTATMSQVGAFALPNGSKDAAIVLDVPAGVYSVQATGATGTPTTGVVLIEIYLVR